MNTLMEQVIAGPIICTKPDGSTHQLDNPLSGLPFISGWGVPDGCVDGPSIAAKAADSLFGPGSWQQAVSDTVASSATFWIDQPSPTVVDAAHQLTGPAANINNSLMWVVFAVFICCVMIKGAQIAWAGARANEHMGELARGIWDWIIAAGVVAGIVGAILAFTDQLAEWMINESSTGGFAANLASFFNNTDALMAVPQVFAYGLMGFAFVFSLLQELVFAARGGGLVIILGVYLLSASTATLRQGRQSHEVMRAWLVGFTLYKLAAACVYSGAFWLIGVPGDSANFGWSVFEGVALIALSVFALWACIKMAMPATEPVAGHGFMQTATTAAFIVR